jgi:hypothetical protein
VVKDFFLAPSHSHDIRMYVIVALYAVRLALIVKLGYQNLSNLIIMLNICVWNLIGS